MIPNLVYELFNDLGNSLKVSIPFKYQYDLDGHYIIHNFLENKIDVPKTMYIRSTLRYETPEELIREELSHILNKSVHALKKCFDIKSDNYAGWLDFRINSSMNTDEYEIRVSGSLLDIDNIIKKAEFDKKLDNLLKE